VIIYLFDFVIIYIETSKYGTHLVVDTLLDIRNCPLYIQRHQFVESFYFDPEKNVRYLEVHQRRFHCIYYNSFDDLCKRSLCQL